MNSIDIDINTLSSDEFRKYKLVDVREQEEIDLWPASIPCHHVPCSNFPDNAVEFFNADESYLIFCAKGGRSHAVAEYLAQEGITALSVNNGIASVNAYLRNYPHAPYA